jgi:hypothetical protein
VNVIKLTFPTLDPFGTFGTQVVSITSRGNRLRSIRETALTRYPHDQQISSISSSGCSHPLFSFRYALPTERKEWEARNYLPLFFIYSHPSRNGVFCVPQRRAKPETAHRLAFSSTDQASRTEASPASLFLISLVGSVSEPAALRSTPKRKRAASPTPRPPMPTAGILGSLHCVSKLILSETVNNRVIP